MKGCISDGKVPEFLEEARKVAGYVQAVNVTDNQSAVMKLGSLASSVYLKHQGIEPIFQMTCRDRNRIALQSDLLSACSLGIENVLCLTGDHIKLGDHKSAKAVFDIDSVQLIAMASNLNRGYDMAGHRLTEPTNMAIGAVVNPILRAPRPSTHEDGEEDRGGRAVLSNPDRLRSGQFESFIKKAGAVWGADSVWDRHYQVTRNGEVHERPCVGSQQCPIPSSTRSDRCRRTEEREGNRNDCPSGSRDCTHGSGGPLHASRLVGPGTTDHARKPGLTRSSAHEAAAERQGIEYSNMRMRTESRRNKEGDHMETMLRIDGMSCQHCVMRVKKAIGFCQA